MSPRLPRASRTGTIVIIGGGPAGLTTALALMRSDPALRSRIVVLERAHYPREKICAGALGHRGFRVLESLGAVPDVPKVPIKGFEIRGARGTRTFERTHVGYVIRRAEFDAGLARQVKRAGICVREGVRVLKVLDGLDAATVITNQGNLRASVVVGADGVGSIVRRSMGLGAGLLRAQAVEVDTGPAAPDSKRGLLCFDASDPTLHGYSWHFPTLVDGSLRVSRGVYSIPCLAANQEEPKLDVTHRLRGLLAEHEVQPDAGFKRFAERGYEPAVPMVVGHRMLVGEAAGIDPITGEGIAPAIQAGAVAGRFLAKVAHGSAALESWSKVFRRSVVGRDLAMRSALGRACYGERRGIFDKALTQSDALLALAARYFAGDRPRSRELARALPAFLHAFTPNLRRRATAIRA